MGGFIRIWVGYAGWIAGGRILDSFRTSLSPTTVEALICTQSWLRSPSGPIDIIKSMEEIEAYEEIQEGIVV